MFNRNLNNEKIKWDNKIKIIQEENYNEENNNNKDDKNWFSNLTNSIKKNLFML